MDAHLPCRLPSLMRQSPESPESPPESLLPLLHRACAFRTIVCSPMPAPPLPSSPKKPEGNREGTKETWQRKQEVFEVVFLKLGYPIGKFSLHNPSMHARLCTSLRGVTTARSASVFQASWSRLLCTQSSVEAAASGPSRVKVFVGGAIFGLASGFAAGWQIATQRADFAKNVDGASTSLAGLFCDIPSVAIRPLLVCTPAPLPPRKLHLWRYCCISIATRTCGRHTAYELLPLPPRMSALRA